MSRAPIFLRVDATQQSGYERFARCMTIAAALQRRRRPVYFLSNLEPASLAMTLKRGGSDWIAMHNPVGAPADLAHVMKEMNRLGPSAILVDSPLATKSYLQELVAAGPMLISIDHQGAIRLPSHLIVNPLLGPSRDSYEYGASAQLLMGSRYAMVRPEIRRHRPTRSQEPAPLPVAEGKGVSFRALVALGEDDPQTKTRSSSPSSCSGAPKIGRVDVVVRKEHPQLEAIQAAAAANPDRLEVGARARRGDCTPRSLPFRPHRRQRLVERAGVHRRPAAGPRPERGALAERPAPRRGRLRERPRLAREHVGVDDPDGGPEPARQPARTPGDGAVRPQAFRRPGSGPSGERDRDRARRQGAARRARGRGVTSTDRPQARGRVFESPRVRSFAAITRGDSQSLVPGLGFFDTLTEVPFRPPSGASCVSRPLSSPLFSSSPPPSPGTTPVT